MMKVGCNNMKQNKDVITLGCIYANPNHRPISGRGCIYSTDGIAPTVLTMSGGGNKPYIIVRCKNEQNNKTRT